TVLSAIYLISPVDIIPEAIIGLLDDLVINYMLNFYVINGCGVSVSITLVNRMTIPKILHIDCVRWVFEFEIPIEVFLCENLKRGKDSLRLLISLPAVGHGAVGRFRQY
ncbi:hypothetical protein RJ639_013450, partial [Escallonia herrerae]